MTNAKTSRPLNKHQAKTEATRHSVLDAAEDIFVRDGYERAQIETIAAHAGRTKGAVYTHFRSKEDIFFALLERKACTRREAFLRATEGEPLQRYLEAGKALFLDATKDETWPILMLEFKLFALRSKDSLHRVKELYKLLHDDASRQFLKKSNTSTENDLDRLRIGLAILRSIPSAVVLEKRFNPVLSSRKNIEEVLEKVFDLLTTTDNSAQASPGKRELRSKAKRVKKKSASNP